jgi:hypothetical protein
MKSTKHRTSGEPLSERQSSRPILKTTLTFFKNIFSKKRITKPVKPPTLPNNLKDYFENSPEVKETQRFFDSVCGDTQGQSPPEFAENVNNWLDKNIPKAEQITTEDFLKRLEEMIVNKTIKEIQETSQE